MTKRKLYIYQDKHWFCTGSPNCDDCGKETLAGMICNDWKRNIINQYLCLKCLSQFELLNTGLQEYKSCVVCVQPPKGSLPSIPDYPGLMNSNDMDCFEAADKQIGTEEIIDNTKLSGRPTTPLLEEPLAPPLISATQDPNLILEFHKTTPPTDQKAYLEWQRKQTKQISNEKPKNQPNKQLTGTTKKNKQP